MSTPAPNPYQPQHQGKKPWSTKKKVGLFGCLPIVVLFSLSTCVGIVAAAMDGPEKDVVQQGKLVDDITPSPTTESAADKARIEANKKAEAEKEAKAAAEAKKAAAEAEKAQKQAEQQNKDEAAMTMLDLVWSAQDKQSQRLMCAGYGLDPDTMWDSFTAGAGEDYVTRKQFDKFMAENC